MKLTISKQPFSLGLQAVQNVAGTRSTLPVLSHVLLQAEDNRVRLIATDLDVSISSEVDAKVVRKGAITLPAKLLVGFVREAPNEEINLEVDDRNVCSLTSGSSRFKLNGLPAEEFPPLPAFHELKAVTLPQSKLKGLIRRTAFAASVEESRYVLNGLFFSFKDHKVTTVATDGRRLALTEEEVEVDPEAQFEFIVPSKAVAELGRLLQDSGTVELRHTENQAQFTLLPEPGANSAPPGGPVVLITKLVEGTYPNYQQVIPRECRERISLSREDFLHALTRAELMTSEKNSAVKLHFTRNQLVITANAPELGEAREVLSLNYKGTEFQIAFNPVYLSDPLRALEAEEVFFELTDELSPGVLKINGPFLYVIMPMRTN
jgi:DNA polymerase-3 subunit beta